MPGQPRPTIATPGPAAGPLPPGWASLLHSGCSAWRLGRCARRARRCPGHCTGARAAVIHATAGAQRGFFGLAALPIVLGLVGIIAGWAASAAHSDTPTLVVRE